MLIIHAPKAILKPTIIAATRSGLNCGTKKGITTDAKQTCPISLEISEIALICGCDNSATNSPHFIYYCSKRRRLPSSAN